MRALEAVDERLSEAEVSRERLRRARREVIDPLRELAERNQFASIIRASLIEGRRGGNGHDPG